MYFYFILLLDRTYSIIDVFLKYFIFVLLCKILCLKQGILKPPVRKGYLTVGHFPVYLFLVSFGTTGAPGVY